jgi:hypothetical protein
MVEPFLALFRAEGRDLNLEGLAPLTVFESVRFWLSQRSVECATVCASVVAVGRPENRLDASAPGSIELRLRCRRCRDLRQEGERDSTTASASLRPLHRLPCREVRCETSWHWGSGAREGEGRRHRRARRIDVQSRAATAEAKGWPAGSTECALIGAVVGSAHPRLVLC